MGESRGHSREVPGMHEVPSDTQMRDIFEGVPVELLRQVLPELCARVRPEQPGVKTFKV
jgi:hypothetical protein